VLTYHFRYCRPIVEVYDMVVSRCRGIGPPSSSIVLGTLFLLAADLRRRVFVGILGIPLPALLFNTNPTVPAILLSFSRTVFGADARFYKYKICDAGFAVYMVVLRCGFSSARVRLFEDVDGLMDCDIDAAPPLL